jgi:hypothetical protein
MQALSELLLKYKVPGVRESEIRRICTEEVLILTGCTLLSTQVQYKNEELRLSVPPVLRSALILRKAELLERIKAREIAIQRIT